MSSTKKGHKREMKPEPGSAYIYGLWSKERGYFYIGSTIQPLSVRLKTHYRSHNSRVRDFITATGRPNVDIHPLAVVPAEMRFIREYEILGNYILYFPVEIC